MHVVVINTKGGSGKTLLATQLACYYATKGEKVAIFDHDSQKSSIDWVKARPKRCAPIAAIPAFGNHPKQEWDGIAIHDMPAGYDVKHLREDVPEVKKVLIPILPSPTDLRVVWRFCMMLTYHGILHSDIEIGFVPNRYRQNASFNPTMMEFLNRMEIPIIGQIRDTQNYIHATNRGLGIFDLPTTQSKVDRQTWQPIIDWLSDIAPNSFAKLLIEDIVEQQKQLDLV